MLSNYITGTIRDTVFRQAQNLPTNEDDVALFKIFTSFNAVAYPQLSIISLKKNHEPHPVDV